MQRYFTHQRAWSIKNWLAANKVSSNIVKPKPEFSLAEHIAKHNPEWLLEKQDKNVAKLKRREYQARRTKILADDSMTELEKYNAIRAIGSLEPVKLEEFELVKAVQSNEKEKKK